MHSSMLSALSVALLATQVHAHGIITVPNPRAVGAAGTAACGSNVEAVIKADNTSHVEGLPESASSDPGYHANKCNLWLCKGLQFDDNVANIQKYIPGQVIPISVWLRILHKGTANVSIVDTATNKIIGDQLLYWSDYADETLKTQPANNTQFNITIPELGGKCTNAGECVIQWWWYGTGARQTYESCIDFTVPKMPMRRRWWWWE